MPAQTVSLSQLQAMGAKPLSAAAPSAPDASNVTPPGTVSLQQLQSMGAKPLSEMTPPSAPSSPSLLQDAENVGGSIVKGVTLPFVRAGLNLTNAAIGIVDPSLAKNIDQQGVNLPFYGPTKEIGTSGNNGRDLADALGTGLEAASNLVPVGEGASIAADTVGGKVLQGAITGAKTGAEAGGTYGVGSGLTDPNATPLTVAESGLEGAAGGAVAGFGLGGAAATPAAVANKLFPSITTLKNQATDYINKALSNTGKTSASGLLSKDANRLSGLETLYNVTKGQTVTRPDGTTFQFDPTKIEQPTDLISAFVQAKNQLWQKVQAGLDKGSSITPDYAPVRAQLQDVIDNSASAALKAHAQSRLNEINTLDTQGVQGAQRYLQEELNPRIGAAVQGATDAPALKLDATVANGINNALDTALSKVKDASVRPYKDMYASLKSIEPDLVRAVQKVERQPGKGIPQYINDFGDIDLLDAFLSHNPAFFLVRGGAKKVLAKVLGEQRSPIENLSKAFQAIEGYSGAPNPLTETPTLALPPGTRGTPSQVGSGPVINLPSSGDTNTRTTFGLPPSRQ